MKKKIGIIGGGNMGAAIMSSILKKYHVSVCELDSKRRQYLKRKYKITSKDLEAVIDAADVIILSVKPQSFEPVLAEVREYLKKDTLVISIAAGITTKYIEKRLGSKVRVIRTMPNLPAKVGSGMTAICKGKNATSVDVKCARDILDHVGKNVVVEEKFIDAITAVSGSGPAYVFLFVECMQKAAKSVGLDDKLAKELVMQTLSGSIDLLDSQKEDAEDLRVKVTSKGGTTQAALDVFKKHNFEGIFKIALKAAKEKSKQLNR